MDVQNLPPPKNCIKFDVLTKVTIGIKIFWEVTSCGLGAGTIVSEVPANACLVSKKMA